MQIGRGCDEDDLVELGLKARGRRIAPLKVRFVLRPAIGREGLIGGGKQLDVDVLLVEPLRMLALLTGLDLSLFCCRRRSERWV